MRRVVLLGVITVAATLVPGAAAAAPPGGGGTPGAAGIGDPYFPLDGNGGYDVERYGLDLRYDPATDLLSGTATIRSSASQALSAFNLDLQGLEVTAITVDGRPATWTRDGGELTVTPRRTLREGRTFTTVVTYQGIPQTLADGSGFLHTDDGALVAGQPDGADSWFPSNDHPADAALLDVAVTVPAGVQAVSNGALQSQRTRQGWTTWRWQAREPMATYLATLAIGQFDIRSYRADGIRFWDAVDPDLFGAPADVGSSVGDNAVASLARQPEILRFLAELFGPYPFRTSGGIVDDAPLGFALETQTRPVYDQLFFSEPTFGDSVVVHELAHQWTGDSVRVDRWADIWLNEGFATYAEWLWAEREGIVGVQEQFDQFAAIPAGEQFWQVLPGDPGPDALFDPAVYYRGAMTLHALRLAVGDEVARQIAQEWVAGAAGQAVTTADFIAVAEEVSGQDLDQLFQTWLYTPAKPV